MNSKKRCGKCSKYTIGLINICYRCDRKQYYKKYYKLNKEKFLKGSKKRYHGNRDECLNNMKMRYQKNKDKIKIYNKEYFQKNYDKLTKNGKEYYEKNKKEINKKIRKRIMKRKETDYNLVLRDTLHSRILSAIKKHKGTKISSSIDLLGASIETVRQHLEDQFKRGMTWKNHGVTGWHIDHMIPCHSFDLANEEEQKKCFHYTNLQPLWYDENLHKKHH